MRGRWIVAVAAVSTTFGAIPATPALAVLGTPGGCPGLDFQYTQEFAFPPAPEGFADDCHSSLGTIGLDARTGAADIGVPVDDAVTVDPQGRLTHINSVANPPFFDVSQPIGFVASVTDPGGQSTFNYDAAGRLASVTGPNPSAITYDPSGRATRLDFPAGHFEALGYDPATGRLTSFGDKGGDTGTYFYDGAGRLAEADTTITLADPIDVFSFGAGGTLTSWSHKTQPASTPNVTTFTVNAAGDVSATTSTTPPNLTMTYSAPHVLTTVVSDTPATIASFTYDAAGRLTVAHGLGTASETFTYDGAGRVISATNQNARTVGFGYDSAGRLSTVTDPLGHVTTITYLPPPDATTGAALAVGASTATITGSVTPKTAPGTSYHFDFGTSLRYGRITPPGSLPGGSAAVAVTSRLSGLRPNTTYHYRVAASNRNGGALGLDRTFRTAPVCTVPQLIGRSLSQARRALVANHCRLGTVHRPRHVSRRTHLRITAQRPGAKAVLPAGGKVNVKLGKT